jgi:CRISPR-associated protein Csd1
MIIQRLHELAQRENLAAGIAFEKMAVPFMVSFDAEGNYLGILDRRTMQTIPGKGKNAKPKSVLDNGKVIDVPRAHGSKTSGKFACFFVDTIARILPVPVEPKDEIKTLASRTTFWEQVALASGESDVPALRACVHLGEKLGTNPDLGTRIMEDLKQLKGEITDKCGLAFVSDEGPSLTEKPEVQKWFVSFWDSLTNEKQESAGKGFCQITGEMTSLPASHGFSFKGFGFPTGSFLISYDKESFQSYNLGKGENSGIGIQAVQNYALALQALLAEQLPGNQKSKFRLGDSVFLFWTREPQDLSFMGLLDSADPEAVQALLSSVHKGKETKAVQTNDFYLLVLTGNSARIVVRDYLEAPLEVIRQHFAQWFKDLHLAPLYPDKDELPFFGLYQLVKATAGDIADPLPTTPNRLLMAALRGDPLPDSILAACLRRIKVEGSAGCTRPRLSLVKLFLVRKGVIVSESLNTEEKSPAYLYGRLLEVFDEIQYAALGDINAGVVDKFYGTFSAAPALLMARLFANAQNHLRKLKNEKPGAFVNLDRKLTELVALLPAQSPKGQLPLREQGLFALGFYHQRAQRNQERADRKSAKTND